MRKLPEGVPDTVFWQRSKGFHEETHVNLLLQPPTKAFEVMPTGTRALLDEALKMVERIDAAWTRDFPQGPDGDYTYMRLSDETRETWNGIRALLAKARGEGT